MTARFRSRCRITDMPITCRHRRLKILREDTPRRQTARAPLAIPPRQARKVALCSSSGLAGSGVCYTAAWLIQCHEIRRFGIASRRDDSREWSTALSAGIATMKFTESCDSGSVADPAQPTYQTQLSWLSVRPRKEDVSPSLVVSVFRPLLDGVELRWLRAGQVDERHVHDSRNE